MNSQSLYGRQVLSLERIPFRHLCMVLAQDGGVDPHGISAARGFQGRCQRRLTSSCVWSFRPDSNGRSRICSPLP